MVNLFAALRQIYVNTYQLGALLAFIDSAVLTDERVAANSWDSHSILDLNVWFWITQIALISFLRRLLKFDTL
jgi:hypothetical protein